MTRIIAGSARGRRIAVPPGRGTRPTADRAREGLFSTLESLVGSLDQRRFLDLYAGSGAVGLEAISRGAAAAILVESNPTAAGLIRANAAAMNLLGVHVYVAQAEQLLRRAVAEAPFDVIFADPPYTLPNADLREVLADAHANGWLADEAVLAVERPTRGSQWSWPCGIRAERFRRYGEATLWYGRAAGPSAPEKLGSKPSEE